MSTKPTTLPRWATDLTNNDEPSSGQKDTGWTVGQDGVSDYDNWVKYWNYKWCEYISDGDVELNNLVVNNSVTFGGTSTSYSFGVDLTTLDPDTAGNVAAYHTIVLAPTVDNLIIHGVAADANTPVGCQVTLLNDGVRPIKIRIGSSTANLGEAFFWGYPHFITTGANEDIILTGACSITLEYAANDQWNVVSANGCLIKRKFGFPVVGMRVNGNTNLQFGTNLAEMEMPSSTSNTAYPFTLPVGSLLTNYIVYAKKNSTSADSLDTRLQSATMGSSVVNDLGTGISDTQNNPGYISTLTESFATPLEIEDGYVYWIKVATTKAGATVDLIQGLIVTAWVPI